MNDRIIHVRLGDRDYTGVSVRFHSYMDPAGGMAVILEQGIERLTVASSNLAAGGHVPAPGCFFLKNYSENEGLLESLVKAGVVEPTGREARSGYVSFPEVRVINHWAEDYRVAEFAARKDRIKLLRTIQKKENAT